LRWINAGSADLFQELTMIRLNRLQSASEQRPEATGETAAGGRLVLATVPAAWPAGISQLAQAVDACQRYQPGEARTDWLAQRV
jgi:hypothetical protein